MSDVKRAFATNARLLACFACCALAALLPRRRARACYFFLYWRKIPGEKACGRKGKNSFTASSLLLDVSCLVAFAHCLCLSGRRVLRWWREKVSGRKEADPISSSRLHVCCVCFGDGEVEGRALFVCGWTFVPFAWW